MAGLAVRIFKRFAMAAVTRMAMRHPLTMAAAGAGLLAMRLARRRGGGLKVDPLVEDKRGPRRRRLWS